MKGKLSVIHVFHEVNVIAGERTGEAGEDPGCIIQK